MAFSLYYEAKRDREMTHQEKQICQEIVARYCQQYPFKRKTEDFGVYELEEEPGIVFQGATKLPGSGPQFLFDVANYWLKCLTEITYVLTDSQWSVTFDDVALILDQTEGWRFPNDEEYRAQKASG